MTFCTRLAITLLILHFSMSVSAQFARGKVLDESGSGVEDTYVYNLRSAQHAHTLADGFFIMDDTRSGDTLVFTHIGFKPHMLVFEKAQSLTVRLTRSEFDLGEVIVSARSNPLNILAAIDTRTNPVSSSQELLRRVPGLFIGQHAGGGKAEQIFLRGFDIAHGTDINISVDGMPVNMVSHAHGQGYADLHFVIPETVDRIDFGKGPYFAERGNLATAGYVAFQTKDRLDHSSVTLEGGKFNTMRTLGMFNLVNKERQSAWAAIEYLGTDGFFESPQNFNRLNVAARYSGYLGSLDKMDISLSHLSSKWNASGQIPQRAVDAGLITRFGSIDPTEGGNTHRTNVNLQHLRTLSDRSSVRSRVYFSQYDFELYSNFTFYLEDPMNGDQIRQKENRNIFGFETEYNLKQFNAFGSIDWKAGTGLRFDRIKDIELSHTLNRRTTLQQTQLGEINETNMFGFASAGFNWGKWLFNPAIRIDQLRFDYRDDLSPAFLNPSKSRNIVSPKFEYCFYTGQPGTILSEDGERIS